MPQPTYRRRNRAGYSLLELIVSLAIFSLLVAGSTALIVLLLRLTNNVNAATMSALDASQAISQVTYAIREAQSFQLMDGGTFGTTYEATDPTTGSVVVTGLRTTAPATAATTTAAIGGSSGNVSLSGANALVDCKNPGTTLDFYRSDKNGVIAPLTGTCLWMTGTLNGAAVSRALVKSIAPGAFSVQFVQPYMPDGTTPLPNAVLVKITCSYYSRINGAASSDSGKGGVTSLTGEVVYLRNHNPFGVTSTGVRGKKQLDP